MQSEEDNIVDLYVKLAISEGLDVAWGYDDHDHVTCVGIPMYDVTEGVIPTEYSPKCLMLGPPGSTIAIVNHSDPRRLFRDMQTMMLDENEAPPPWVELLAYVSSKPDYEEVWVRIKGRILFHMLYTTKDMYGYDRLFASETDEQLLRFVASHLGVRTVVSGAQWTDISYANQAHYFNLSTAWVIPRRNVAGSLTYANAFQHRMDAGAGVFTMYMPEKPDKPYCMDPGWSSILAVVAWFNSEITSDVERGNTAPYYLAFQKSACPYGDLRGLRPAFLVALDEFLKRDLRSRGNMTQAQQQGFLAQILTMDVYPHVIYEFNFALPEGVGPSPGKFRALSAEERVAIVATCNLGWMEEYELHIRSWDATNRFVVAGRRTRSDGWNAYIRSYEGKPGLVGFYDDEQGVVGYCYLADIPLYRLETSYEIPVPDPEDLETSLKFVSPGGKGLFIFQISVGDVDAALQIQASRKKAQPYHARIHTIVQNIGVGETRALMEYVVQEMCGRAMTPNAKYTFEQTRDSHTKQFLDLFWPIDSKRNVLTAVFNINDLMVISAMPWTHMDYSDALSLGPAYDAVKALFRRDRNNVGRMPVNKYNVFWFGELSPWTIAILPLRPGALPGIEPLVDAYRMEIRMRKNYQDPARAKQLDVHFVYGAGTVVEYMFLGSRYRTDPKIKKICDDAAREAERLEGVNKRIWDVSHFINQ